MVSRVSKDEVKEVDIRYEILRLENAGSTLKMVLSLGSAGYAKPQEVLTCGFGMKENEVLSLLIKREGLYVRKEDKYLSPMEII